MVDLIPTKRYIQKTTTFLTKQKIKYVVAHIHHQSGGIENKFKVAIALTAAFFVVELVGGFMSGSLSLVGDAGHMFRDVFALVFSFSAMRLAKKPATKRKTYGYHRVKIIAALTNGILLLAISGWILWEAYQRISTPEPVKGITMLIVAAIGLAVNLYVMFQLYGSNDLNIRSAFFHVFADMLSSVAVIAAGIWILATGNTIVDPIIGIGIAVFILISAVSVINESLHILLQFTPKHIDIDKVVEEIKKIKNVRGVHDVHIWSLASDINMADAHVHVKEVNWCEFEKIKREIKKIMEIKFDIKHVTLEFECDGCLKKCRLEGLH